MQISGEDYTFEVRIDMLGNSADLILRMLRDKWPDGVFETEMMEQPISLRDASVWSRFENADEFFVYSDSRAAKTWNDEGLTSENENQMIHVILRRMPVRQVGEITIVVDRVEGDLRQWIDRVRDTVERESIYFGRSTPLVAA